MKLAFISPIAHLDKAISHSTINMALAHLCDQEEYTKPFKESSNYTILDNSFFELGHCLDKDIMLGAAKKVGADCLVMSDGTTDSITTYKEAGYDVMYIPTSIDDFVNAMYDENIDKVGLSFYWTSKIEGLPKNNPTARYNFLVKHFREDMNKEKIHLLGATDSIYEGALCKHYAGSWDSSAAVWNGMFRLDLSKQKTKNPNSVDFFSDEEWSHYVTSNIKLIKEITQ